MTSLPRNHRMVRLGDLTTAHTGRQIDVAGYAGTLQAVIAVARRIQLGLLVGSARVWTDWLPATDTAEVWKPERASESVDLCVWCADEKHEKCRGADSCTCPCTKREES